MGIDYNHSPTLSAERTYMASTTAGVVAAAAASAVTLGLEVEWTEIDA